MASVTGGDKAKAYLQNIANEARNKQLNVGFLSNATYPSRTVAGALSKSGRSRKMVTRPGAPVALIAAVQEYGSPTNGIPSRPFFRNMIKAKQNEWGPAAAKLLKATNYDVSRTFETLGIGIKGQLQASIQTYNAGPPLSRRTIARKGFSKQLIDTSVMVNSVDYEVKG